MSKMIRNGPPGKSVRLPVDFWLEKDGTITLAATAQEPGSFIVTIKRDHAMFKYLAACLSSMGAPAPVEVEHAVHL